MDAYRVDDGSLLHRIGMPGGETFCKGVVAAFQDETRRKAIGIDDHVQEPR